MSAPHHTPFPATHFRLEQLADGVYAAIDNNQGTAVGNAGIVDLGNAALIFDTLITPKAARDLRMAAEQLTGHSVKWVVNSHYHNDHIRGNQVFADAAILSAEKTRQQILTDGLDELTSDTVLAPQRVVELQAEYEATTDTQTRNQILFWLDYSRAIAESLPELQLCPPTQTFKEQLNLYGSQREVNLISYGGGHTASDTILYIPDVKVAFLSDLLFVGCHPFLADGDPEAWLVYLDRLRALDMQTLVPGHGPVGHTVDLEHMRKYLVTAMQIATELVQTGQSADDAAQVPIPSAFADWGLASFFAANMRFLYGYCSRV